MNISKRSPTSTTRTAPAPRTRSIEINRDQPPGSTALSDAIAAAIDFSVSPAGLSLPSPSGLTVSLDDRSADLYPDGVTQPGARIVPGDGFQAKGDLSVAV